MTVIDVDEDQADWGSSRIYGDGDLPGLWIPDKGIGHWGGRTIPPLLHINCRRILRGWQRYHIATKGWRDIAYNYPFCNHGVRFRARGWNPSGATSGDYEGDGIPENNEAVAIVHIGGSGGSISPAGLEAAGDLWRQVQAVIALELQVGIGHRDVKQTACPGNQYYNWIHNQGWILPTPPPPPTLEDDMNYRKILDLIGSAKLEELRLAGRWSGTTAYYFDGRSDQEEGANQNLVEHLFASGQVASLNSDHSGDHNGLAPKVHSHIIPPQTIT